MITTDIHLDLSLLVVLAYILAKIINLILVAIGFIIETCRFMNTLKQRLDKGEITTEEYEKKVKDLMN